MKVSQSTNQQRHHMIKCLTVVLNFGMILSSMLWPDTASLILLNHNLCPSFSEYILQMQY